MIANPTMRAIVATAQCHHCYAPISDFAVQDWLDTGGHLYCDVCLEDAYVNGECTDCDKPLSVPNPEHIDGRY